jgi:hypothetical protein
MNLTITDKLCAHIQAGYVPAPRASGPADDTLERALIEIEHARSVLAQERAKVAELRRRIAELEHRS